MTDFAEKIRAIETLGTPAKLLTFDLSVAATDREYNITGDVIGVWLAPFITDQIQIRFNDRSEPSIPFVQGLALEMAFNRVFVTVPGTGTGTMYVVYGIGAPQLIRMLVNAQNMPTAWASMVAALQAIQGELQGDTDEENWSTEKTVNMSATQILAANTNRKAFSVQAKSTNNGIVYVGFDSSVTNAKWVWELQAGQGIVIDDYRGEIQAIGSLVNQRVGWGEW